MVIFHSYVAVYQRVLIWLPGYLRRHCDGKMLPGLQGFDGIHLVAPDRSIACNLQRWPALGNVGKRWETALKYVEICWNIPEISLKYPWNIPESSHESSHESSWMNLVMNVTKTFPKSCCSWFAWFHLPLFGSMFHIFCLVSSCLASCCVDYLAAFRETSCLPLHYSF
jgi:hypothetical protein